MLRIALSRTPLLARSALARHTKMSVVVSSPLAQLPMRLGSTQAPDPRRAALDAKDNLQRDWDAKVLLYDELKPRTQRPSPDAYLIDVREPDEVLQGSIPSSVNLPLTVLANSLHLQRAAFKKQFGFDKPRRDQEVIFYCRSGKRSTSACDIAKRNGYTNVLNYVGSWLDWVEREGKKSD